MKWQIHKYIPMVLLVLWVALTQVIEIPWAAVSTKEDEAQWHKMLVLSEGLKKTRTIAYEAVLLDSLGLLRHPEQILIYSPASYQPGDVLLCRCRLENGRTFVHPNESALLEHRTTSEISIRQGKLRLLSLRYRDKLEQILKKYPMKTEELALIESLVLADRRSLSMDQREAFQDAGAMHVLAVSGMHVGIVSQLLLMLVTLGGLIVIPWERKWLRYGQQTILLAGIWGYAFLTGLATPVVRCCIMMSIVPINEKYRHHNADLRYHPLATAALIILLINPEAIHSVSFLLSFSAVLALQYYSHRWSQWLHSRNKVVQLLEASLAAQIGTLPWTLYFFGQSANYFLLTGMVAVPMATILTAVVLLGLSLGTIGAPVWFVQPLLWASNYIAYGMNVAVRWIQHLPGATTFVSWNGILTALLWGVIVALTLAMRTTQKRRKYCYLLLAATLGAVMLWEYRLVLLP